MTAASRFEGAPLASSAEGADMLLRLVGIEFDQGRSGDDRVAGEDASWLRPLCGTSDLADANPVLVSMGRAFADSLRRQLAADPTAQARLAAICERLFVECVRGRLSHLPADQTGWLAAQRDPAIARALCVLHDEVRETWTVAMLARRVNMSRSAFARRFMAVVGQPPRRYQTMWRMQLATRLLLETRQTIAQIAYELGYETDTGFGRAFCREFGCAPAAWRRRGGRSAEAADPPPAAFPHRSCADRVG